MTNEESPGTAARATSTTPIAVTDSSGRSDTEPAWVARFWRKVDRTASPNGCWLWTAARSGCGYGYLKVDGKAVPAHRLSWELVNGAIPAGVKLDHHSRCSTRLCVRPEHLRFATEAAS